MTVYSQDDEEKHIVEYFGTGVGRFLDIGAYNGVSFSNTRRLAELGWAGVCVEPSHNPFDSLQQLYRGQSRIQCVNVAVSTNPDGYVDLWETDDAVSTTDPAHRDLWSKKATFRQVKVANWHIDTFLQQHPGPYDFISIDTEGTSARLALCDARSWAIAIAKAQAICIEHDGRIAELDELFIRGGFKRKLLTPQNLLFAR